MPLVYQRKTQKVIDEPQFGSRLLGWLYGSVTGRMFLKILIQPFWSRVYGWYMRSPLSRSLLERFVRQYDIEKRDFTKETWQNFASFFVRTYRHIAYDTDTTSLIAVAEAQLSMHDIHTKGTLTIKQRRYRLGDIVGDDTAAHYAGGTAFLYKLSMHDYHRFIYPDDGLRVFSELRPGVLHTVSSLADDYPVYSINKRCISMFDTTHSGRVTMVEIGAMTVGDIVNHATSVFGRGDEKGYFALGGSSIVVLYEKGRVIPDDDIIQYNHKQVSVRVKIGEKIGVLCSND